MSCARRVVGDERTPFLSDSVSSIRHRGRKRSFCPTGDMQESLLSNIFVPVPSDAAQSTGAYTIASVWEGESFSEDVLSSFGLCVKDTFRELCKTVDYIQKAVQKERLLLIAQVLRLPKAAHRLANFCHFLDGEA